MSDNTHMIRSARAWARQMLKVSAVILDFETTDIKNADIVQVGALRTDGTVLMNTLVRPDLPISPGAQRVHGITMQTVADSPRFHQVYPALSRVLAGETVVAYNAPFEQRILGEVCGRRRLPLPRLREWACAMRQYARFYGQMGSRGYRWQSLSNACTQQKIRVVDAHDALGDCRLTLALLQVMATGD